MGDLGSNLLPGCGIQGRPGVSENFHHIPIQMILVVAVESDAGGKLDAVELQHTLRYQVQMPHLAVKVRKLRETSSPCRPFSRSSPVDPLSTGPSRPVAGFCQRSTNSPKASLS